jgi:hypothetical protein
MRNWEKLHKVALHQHGDSIDAVDSTACRKYLLKNPTIIMFFFFLLVLPSSSILSVREEHFD